jgi:hypothetical protein
MGLPIIWTYITHPDLIPSLNRPMGLPIIWTYLTHPDLIPSLNRPMGLPIAILTKAARSHIIITKKIRATTIDQTIVQKRFSIALLLIC